jgi:hypothetical protein
MERIGDRLIVVSFDEPYPVNVCIVLGVKTELVFVLDAHLGPESMNHHWKALQGGCALRRVTGQSGFSEYACQTTEGSRLAGTSPKTQYALRSTLIS